MSKYKVEINGYNINDYEKMTHAQTMELLAKYQRTQDPQYKEQLVLSNLKLVLSLAQKFHQRVNNLDDLFQVGVIGLIKAIENFNLELDVRFSTYAVPLVIGEMKRYLRDNSAMRIPRSVRDLAYKALLLNENYMKTYSKDATTQELSRLLEVNEEQLVEALSSTHSVTSLSQEVQSDGNGQIDLESQIPDKKSSMEEVSNHIDLYDAMNQLDEKELQIINERYFHGHTQSEIARELFVSQAQVSRMEKQALSRLKKYLNS